MTSMQRSCLLTVIGLSLLSNVAGASGVGPGCMAPLVSGVTYDARILEDLRSEDRVMIRVHFKSGIEPGDVPTEQQARIADLERANPGCTALPGFVSQLLVMGALQATGEKFRFTYCDGSPNPLVETDRSTFEKLVTYCGPWIDRLSKPENSARTIIQ